MVYTTYLWWFWGWFMALFQPHYSRSWMVRGLNQMFQSLERPTHLVPPAHLWSRSPPSHIVGSHSNPVNHSWHYGFGENRPRKPIGSPKISENLMVNHPFPHTQKKAILRILLGYPHVSAQAHLCIGTWNWNSLKISWDLDRFSMEPKNLPDFSVPIPSTKLGSTPPTPPGCCSHHDRVLPSPQLYKWWNGTAIEHRLLYQNTSGMSLIGEIHILRLKEWK